MPSPWLMRKSAAVPFTWRRRAARTQLLTPSPPSTPQSSTLSACVCNAARPVFIEADGDAANPARARGPRSPS